MKISDANVFFFAFNGIKQLSNNSIEKKNMDNLLNK